MQAGLSRLGTDFGNGERDALFFQRDSQASHYAAAKRAVHAGAHAVADPESPAFVAGLDWIRETLSREAPEALQAAETNVDARDPFEAIALAVQEDIAILEAGKNDRGRALALDVRFPSGWRPERLVDADFVEIHRPVPGFADQEAVARSMVRSMVDRGPYVRFVWTLSADGALDHHPDSGLRRSWDAPERVWLRVERQVTVPLGAVRASVFLIRTYLYPLESLDEAQRHTIGQALDAMSEEIRRYKALPSRARIERFL